MVHIKFKYRDKYCKIGKFNTQECTVRSIEECIKIYGLDQSDVEYEIISEKEVPNE